MMRLSVVFVIFWSVCGTQGWTDRRERKFPDEFMFGVASSAYQVEGAWNKDDKGESIWDRYLHDNPHVITDGVNGDIAADSYHHYNRDVQMCRELGVDFYRFSISWPRVLPTGFPDVINEKGFEYYDNLINELLKYDIQPMVTLYHFDLPQKLQDLGGWTNSSSIKWFKDYAKIVFQRYAKRVRYWITINQPDTICVQGYGEGSMAPGIRSSGIKDYECVKNVLLAHASVYKLYQMEFRKNKGMVGISIAVNWADPKNNQTANVEAAELYREFTIGLYMNPIWSEDGDFPQKVRETVYKKSMEQGLGVSRLPKLSNNEIYLLKGSADFLGMNHYTTVLVEHSDKEFEVPSMLDDMSVELSVGDKWRPAKSGWLKSAPYGLYKALIHLNKQYDYPNIIITEHGWSTDSGLQDKGRVSNMRHYLAALALGLEDGSQVSGYTAWSLMDNVEWTAGISERFGLYEVDFDSSDKKRTARLSALVYKHLIKTRVATDEWLPKNLRMTIDKRESKDELNGISMNKVMRAYNPATAVIPSSLWWLTFVLYWNKSPD